MSRASATFFLSDGSKLFGIYSGSADVLQRCVSDSSQIPWSLYYGSCQCWGENKPGDATAVNIEHDGTIIGTQPMCSTCLCYRGKRERTYDYEDISVRFRWPDGSFTFGGAYTRAASGWRVSGWSLRDEQQALAYRTYECLDAKAHGHEDVVVRADYGDGIEWHTSICLTCRIVVGPTAPFDEEANGYDPLDAVRSRGRLAIEQPRSLLETGGHAVCHDHKFEIMGRSSGYARMSPPPTNSHDCTNAREIIVQMIEATSGIVLERHQCAALEEALDQLAPEERGTLGALVSSLRKRDLLPEVVQALTPYVRGTLIGGYGDLD